MGLEGSNSQTFRKSIIFSASWSLGVPSVRIFSSIDSDPVPNTLLSHSPCLLPSHFFSFLDFTVSIILSTTLGSLNVDVSPKLSSSPLRIFLRILLMIFPDLVFGRSSTMKTALGAANGPMDFRTCRMRSFRVCSLGSVPSLRATKAFTAWPVNSSLIPTTAASATPLCSMRAASISAVDRRWPETLTTSSTRPRIQ